MLAPATNEDEEHMMRGFAGTGLALLLGLLTGCATIEPAVQTTAKPETGMAYVAGQFSRSNSGGFAFVLQNLDSNAEYSMSLGEDGTWPKDVKDQVLAVKLPPGRYAVKQWFTYGTLTKERSRSHAVSNTELSRPFQVGSGSVLFLGGFSADTVTRGTQIFWTIKPRLLKEDEAQTAFQSAYPALAALPFECHMCISPLLPPWMVPKER